jgi:hypothetical protein
VVHTAVGAPPGTRHATAGQALLLSAVVVSLN